MSEIKFYARSVDPVWLEAIDIEKAIGEILRGHANERLGDVVRLDAATIDDAIDEVTSHRDKWPGDDPTVLVFDEGDVPRARVRPARPGIVTYKSAPTRADD